MSRGVGVPGDFGTARRSFASLRMTMGEWRRCSGGFEVLSGLVSAKMGMVDRYPSFGRRKLSQPSPHNPRPHATEDGGLRCWEEMSQILRSVGGTAGDHQGPPFPTSPPSPLRDLRGFTSMGCCWGSVHAFSLLLWGIETFAGVNTPAVWALHQPIRMAGFMCSPA